jgi:phosphatidylserine/phosphatidylglycerophosphate/cardiolipin synthase-like enzyme
MAAAVPTLFKPGSNCYRAARARRAALLIDGDAYFHAFAQAALSASHSIIIVGWDFHSATRLHLGLPGVPDLLGDFLNFLVRRTRSLRIFILTWNCPLVFAKGRESRVGSAGGWQPHRRITFHYDANCPMGGALHQKIVVIDGALAFCGGIDLALGRWDTPAHVCDDPRRTNPGESESYPPIHDAMLVVDAGAARALHAVVRQRWQDATGRTLPTTYTESDPWPLSVPVMFRDVSVGLARTVPARGTEPAVVEVENLYLDMIAAARRYIYLENQYFTAKSLGDALAARLAEPQGPEVMVVVRLESSGWLEEPTMTALRSQLLRKLRAADVHGRFSAWYPETPGEPCCDVHSKLMIVDDEWLRVGSANFANRSMGLDTECDLVIEARGDRATRRAIASARNALLSEHLDVAPHDVENTVAVTHSLASAVETLSRSSGRTLRAFARLDSPSLALLAVANGIADRESPLLGLEELMAGVRVGSPHAVMPTVPSDE